ncbi:hypothetical protein [Vibrio phage vB_pir03]|nr:hypothetical protein [Vibrio phage vB_pir03]
MKSHIPIHVFQQNSHRSQNTKKKIITLALSSQLKKKIENFYLGACISVIPVSLSLSIDDILST